MKVIANTGVVLFFLLLLSGNQLSGQDMRSLWLKEKVVTDGKSAEWPQPFRYYDSQTKLQYAIANDSANIYICLKLTDEPTQMRLFRAGLNIWLDPKGKKKETIGISFPMKVTSPTDIPKPKENGGGQIPGQSYQKHDFNQMKARIVAHQQTLKVTGFFGVQDQQMPLVNGYGINAAYDWDSLNILTIEYQVPIALALKRGLLPADTINPIGIGFIEIATGAGGPRNTGGEADQGGWNGGNTGGGNMGGQNGTPGMGDGSGGMNGGGMRNDFGQGGYNSANEEQKLWTKILLAL